MPSCIPPACSAARSVDSGVCARKCLYASHENSEKFPSSPWVYPPQLQQRTLSPIRHSSSGLVTGSDFNITWCTSVKMAVVAPIPSASVIKAVVVNPGALRSCRTASRKSASICPYLSFKSLPLPKRQGVGFLGVHSEYRASAPGFQGKIQRPGSDPTDRPFGDCRLDLRRGRRIVTLLFASIALLYNGGKRGHTPLDKSLTMPSSIPFINIRLRSEIRTEHSVRFAAVTGTHPQLVTLP